MDMRCSVYLRPPQERQAYIDEKIAGLLTYYQVADEDKERFLAEPIIKCLANALNAVNMSIQEIVSYLGEGFARDRTWEGKGGGDE